VIALGRTEHRWVLAEQRYLSGQACRSRARLIIEDECDHVATGCVRMDLIRVPSWRGFPRARNEPPRFSARPSDEIGPSVVVIHRKIRDATESRICSVADDEAFNAKNPNPRRLRFVDEIARSRGIYENLPPSLLNQMWVSLGKVFEQAHGH
jgi:hypothetical protein